MWEGTAFFGGFAAYDTVHRGAHSVTETTVDGLRSDTKVRLRIRAKGETFTLAVTVSGPPRSED